MSNGSSICARKSSSATVLLFRGFQRADLLHLRVGCGGISRDRVVGSVVVVERREGEPLNLKQLWHAALGELQLGLTKANYDTWFKDTAIVSEEDDVYCVGVPNAFAREWLENKYRQQVRSSLQRLVGRTVDVRFITVPGGQSPAAGTGVRPANAANSGGNQGVSSGSVTPI